MQNGALQLLASVASPTPNDVFGAEGPIQVFSISISISTCS